MKPHIAFFFALVATFSPGCAVSEAADAPAEGSTEALEKTWSECAADSDCVAVRGVCGRWVGVHKDHVPAAEAHYKRINMLVRCKQLSEPVFPIACEKLRCTIKRPNGSS